MIDTKKISKIKYSSMLMHYKDYLDLRDFIDSKASLNFVNGFSSSFTVYGIQIFYTLLDFVRPNFIRISNKGILSPNNLKDWSIEIPFDHIDNVERFLELKAFC